LKSILALISLISATAFANPVTLLTTELRSDKIDGVRKIRISPEEGGMLRVSIDPNHCANSGACTKMAVASQVVDAKVIREGRPADGDLLLQLTSSLSLSISSGFNMDGHVALTAIITNSDGSTTRFPLIPEVTAQIGN
jgi:hypothetical protein